MKRLTFLVLFLMIRSSAFGDQIQGCIPDKEPTKTPHCTMSRIYTLEGAELFQVELQPYGTCETNTISAGSFKQVLDEVVYNNKEQNLFICAGVGLKGDIYKSKIETPYCTIVQKDSKYMLYHSLSREPLFVGSFQEVIEIKNLIIENMLELCGRGIF